MQVQMIYFLAAVFASCVACYFTGFMMGKRKALSQILFAKQQEETARHWKEVIDQINRRDV